MYYMYTVCLTLTTCLPPTGILRSVECPPTSMTHRRSGVESGSEGDRLVAGGYTTKR